MKTLDIKLNFMKIPTSSDALENTNIAKIYVWFKYQEGVSKYLKGDEKTGWYRTSIKEEMGFQFVGNRICDYIWYKIESVRATTMCL